MLSKIVSSHYQTFILFSDTKTDIDNKYAEYMKPDDNGKKDITTEITDYFKPNAGPSNMDTGPNVSESGDSKVIADISLLINDGLSTLKSWHFDASKDIITKFKSQCLHIIRIKY